MDVDRVDEECATRDEIDFELHYVPPPGKRDRLLCLTGEQPYAMAHAALPVGVDHSVVEIVVLNRHWIGDPKPLPDRIGSRNNPPLLHPSVCIVAKATTV